MEKFSVDEILRDKMIRQQIKKHPKWKRRGWLRALWLLVAITFTAIMAYAIKSTGEFIPSFAFIMFIVIIFTIGCVPYLFYLGILMRTCRDSINNKTNETLILTDSEIKNTYLPLDAKRKTFYDEDLFEYTKVKRLVVNEYHNTLRIYGNWKKVWYEDYSKGIIQHTRGIKTKESNIRLYLYYRNSEELINEIKSKSGVEIERISTKEE